MRPPGLRDTSRPAPGGATRPGRGAGVAHTRPRRATEAALPSWAVISTNERSDAGGGAVSPTCHASAPEPMLARGVAPLSAGVCCLRGPACIPLLPRARAQRAGGDPASPRAHLTASHGLLEVCAVRQKMRKEERRGVTPGPREASCRHAGQTERRRHRVARTSPRLHHYAYVTALQHRSTAPLYVTALRHRVCGAALRHHFTSPRLSTLDHAGSRARWGTRVPSEQSAANGLRTPPSPTFLRSRLTLRQAQLKPFRVSDSSGEPQARPGDPRHTLQPRVPDVCIFNKLQV